MLSRARAVSEAVRGAVHHGVREVDRRLLLALLAVVGSLVMVHVVRHSQQDTDVVDDWLASDTWSLEADRQVPESWGYLLLLAAVVMLVWRARAQRHRLYLAWAAAFALALVDDAFQLHERVGWRVTSWSWVPDRLAGLGTQDLVELGTWAGLAVVPLLAVVVSHRRSTPTVQRDGLLIGLLALGYVGVGIGLDMVHSLIDSHGLAVAIGIGEDGGELLVLSVLVAVLFGLSRRATDVRPPVRQATATVTVG
ncbi:hypothetical protein [Modestobacter sp. SYSU DS0657]